MPVWHTYHFITAKIKAFNTRGLVPLNVCHPAAGTLFMPQLVKARCSRSGHWVTLRLCVVCVCTKTLNNCKLAKFHDTMLFIDDCEVNMSNNAPNQCGMYISELPFWNVQTSQNESYPQGQWLYPDTLSKARVFDVRQSPNIACDTHIAAQQGVLTLRLASMQQ